MSVAPALITCWNDAASSRCATSSQVRCRLAPRGMVEFARAIVDPPTLLLLDEPASGLDELETARLGEQIRAVRDETECAVLLVEHNAAFVMEQCDRVVVLDLGTLLASGLPEEIQRNQAVRDAYLGAVQHGDDVPGGTNPDADAPAGVDGDSSAELGSP